MNALLFRFNAIALFVLLSLLCANPVYADITCSNLSISAVNFGSVDPQSSLTDTTATLTYTCKSNRLLPGFYDSATLCFSIGEPGGGITNPRQMEDVSNNTLDFQIYQNPSRSVIWGSQFFGSPTPLMVNVTLEGGFFGGSPVTYTSPVYGRVLAGQTTAIAGSYTNQYGSSDTALTINSVTGQTAPGSCSTNSRSSLGSFTVSANVVEKCRVNAGPLNFGHTGLLSGMTNTSTTLVVQCSVNTPYQVGLNAGQHSGGNINARQMVLGGNSIGYQLYRNAARTDVWGDTVGTNTVAGIGTGNNQNLIVYGRVPPQSTPPAGTYNDTVVVTVTY